MNYSMTLTVDNITKAILLVAILLGHCISLSSASQVQIRFRAQVTVQPPSDEASTQSATTETTSITERAPSSRDHFKQLLRHYYTDPHTGGVEELASFFSISEMYRLGPLATDPRADNPPPLSFIENNEQQCQRMVDRLNTNQQSADYCHWRYTCNYNANRFPTMIINATECTAVQGAECIKRETMMQTFTRSFVGTEGTWRKDDEPVNVVYAYTCRRR